MTHHALRFVSTVSMTTGMALLVMSCSLPYQRQASRTDQHIGSQKIAQLDFGRNASFAVCTEPACPAVTSKTLPVMWPTAPAPAPVIDTAAPLEHGEALLTATPSTPHPAPVIVHFASGSAMLSASGKALLDQALSSARQADRIAIASRTDSVGSDNTNQALALARARAVRDYLRTRLPSHGHAFTLDAQGACCFIASNDTPEGRRQNRRVEIVFGVSGQVAP